MQNMLWYALGAVALLIFIVLLRTGHFVRTLFFSALTGNAALLAIGWGGAFTGITLLPNIFTVGVATILGIPGVLSMLLLRLIFLL